MEKEKYQSLREFLPGWQEDMPEVYGRLAEIFAQQVFELHMGQGADGKPQEDAHRHEQGHPGDPH